ncbi:MAG: hypothetical protein QOJ50_681 [Cryptosporangiaceae bacterium]|jgi:hypothetical protein|nr:hypothetical protein [Cryptosporangiaceae bacterium]
MTWQSANDRQRGVLLGGSALLASSESRGYLFWRRG